MSCALTPHTAITAIDKSTIARRVLTGPPFEDKLILFKTFSSP
jgi:hypothetical protein